VVQGEVL